MDLSPVSNSSSLSTNNFLQEVTSPTPQQVHATAQQHFRNIHRNGSLEPIEQKSIAYIFGEQVIEPLIQKMSDLFEWFFPSPQSSTPPHRRVYLGQSREAHLASTPPPRRVYLGQSRKAHLAGVKRKLLEKVGIENQEQLDRLNEQARAFKKTKSFAMQIFNLWKENPNQAEKKVFVQILESAKNENPHANEFLCKIRRLQRSQDNGPVTTTVSN